jgi:hypothetical protein
MSRLFSIASSRGMALQPDCQAQTRLFFEASTKCSLSPLKKYLILRASVQAIETSAIWGYRCVIVSAARFSRPNGPTGGVPEP